jgi:MSHA biogenesis protein MshJ
MNMKKLQLGLEQWLPRLQTHWQRGRRAFDARMLTERRLIVVAVAAVIWLLMDSVWVTPSYEKLNKANKERAGVQANYEKFKNLALQHEAEVRAKQAEAKRELTRMRQAVKQGEQELQEVQSMLAPAREMRRVLESMLAQHGQLRVKSMTTVSPKEVSLGVGATPEESIRLYSHGMDITVEGSFADMLNWLRSIETMPHRLLWDSISLQADSQAQLSLRVAVHTFSPDREALEISP